MMDHNEQYKGKVVARRYQVHSCFLQERSDIEPLQGCVYACPTNTPTLAPNGCPVSIILPRWCWCWRSWVDRLQLQLPWGFYSIRSPIYLHPISPPPWERSRLIQCHSHRTATDTTSAGILVLHQVLVESVFRRKSEQILSQLRQSALLHQRKFVRSTIVNETVPATVASIQSALGPGKKFVPS